jgi:hypothetical protein
MTDKRQREEMRKAVAIDMADTVDGCRKRREAIKHIADISREDLFELTYLALDPEEFKAKFHSLCPSPDAENDLEQWFRQPATKSNASYIITTWVTPATETKTKEERTAYFLASAGSAEVYNGRRGTVRASWALSPRLPVCVRDNVPVDPMALDSRSVTAVVVIAGETGSGKTTAAFLAAVNGIYLTARDIDTSQLKAVKNQPGDEGKKARNDAVSTILVNAVERVLNAVFGEGFTAPTTGEMTLAVVMDEMGGERDFVRGACSMRSDIQVAIATLLGDDGRGRIKVKLVVCGTGTDVLCASPGSLPDSFTVLAMPRNNDMLAVLLGSLQRLATGMTRSKLVKQCHDLLEVALQDDPNLRQLAQNPRYAACLFDVIATHYSNPPFVNADSARLYVSNMLPYAAYAFKGLNGMLNASADEVQKVHRAALRLAFGGPHVQILDATISELISIKGILVDRAQWVRKAESGAFHNPPDGYVQVVFSDPLLEQGDAEPEYRERLENNGTYALFAPKSGRYFFSPAQQVLFRMGYGLSAMMRWSSDEYEHSIAEFLWCALYGLQGKSLGDLLDLLHRPSGQEQGPKPDWSSHRSQALAYSAVTMCVTHTSESKFRIDADTTANDLKDVKRLVVNNEAVVIVNAPRASFADIVVVIPLVAVLLVQCKFYKDTTPLTKGMLVVEMKKQMTMPKGLGALGNGLPVVHVLATSKAMSKRLVLLPPPKPKAKGKWKKVTGPANKKEAMPNGFLVWCTKGEDSLAPLCTPMPQPAGLVGRVAVRTGTFG